MQFDHALHGDQSDAGSGEILRRVKAFKSAKQLMDESHVKTGAVVPDKKAGFALGAQLAADIDPSQRKRASLCHLLLGSVLKCTLDADDFSCGITRTASPIERTQMRLPLAVSLGSTKS